MSSELPSNQPLATYSEKSPGLRRTYTLYANKVTIQSSRFGGQEFVLHISLSNLTSDIGVTRFRSRRCLAGAMLCGALGFMLWIFLAIFEIHWQSPRVLVVIGLLVACLGWAAMYYPKYTAYNFTNTMGVLVLDVIEAGPEKANAKAFAKQISNAILRCQEQQLPPKDHV